MNAHTNREHIYWVSVCSSSVCGENCCGVWSAHRANLWLLNFNDVCRFLCWPTIRQDSRSFFSVFVLFKQDNTKKTSDRGLYGVDLTRRKSWVTMLGFIHRVLTHQNARYLDLSDDLIIKKNVDSFGFGFIPTVCIGYGSILIKNKYIIFLQLP